MFGFGLHVLSNSGLRYSYGISASVRLNCLLQGRKLAGKIQQRGLEFTQKVQLSLAVFFYLFANMNAFFDGCFIHFIPIHS